MHAWSSSGAVAARDGSHSLAIAILESYSPSLLMILIVSMSVRYTEISGVACQRIGQGGYLYPQRIKRSTLGRQISKLLSKGGAPKQSYLR